MTTPPAPQAPPPPAAPSGLDDPALAIAVAAVLAGAAAGTAAVTAAAAAAALGARFALTAAAVAALTAILTMLLAGPPPTAAGAGLASARVLRVNLARRAQFAVAAVKRITAAAKDAQAGAQLARERQWYRLHQAAIANRVAAAARTDAAAARYGNLLGWLAVKDNRTSPECAAASGKNFYASSIPDIGLPGSVHPHCRCLPVAPWPGGMLLPGSRPPGYVRAA